MDIRITQTRERNDSLLVIDADSLDMASTEDLQDALRELDLDATCGDSEAEELAGFITDELWSRGEQDLLA